MSVQESKGGGLTQRGAGSISYREDEYISAHEADYSTAQLGTRQVLATCKGISVGMQMYNDALMFQTITVGHP